MQGDGIENWMNLIVTQNFSGRFVPKFVTAGITSSSNNHELYQFVLLAPGLLQMKHSAFSMYLQDPAMIYQILKFIDSLNKFFFK